MKKAFLLPLLISSTIASVGLSAQQQTAEETVASKVIGRVLTAIDYSKTKLMFNYFEGAFIKNAKDDKSFLRIDDLNAGAVIQFKKDIIIEPNELSDNSSKSPTQQSKQWMPQILLQSKDLQVLSTIDADNNNTLNIKVNLNKQINASESGLKIVVGNDYNPDLINMNLVALNIQLQRKQNSSEMTVSGSCIARKKLANAMQTIPTCTFGGSINTENDTYNIQVKFGDKKQVTETLK